jgi:hypothetical protein
MRQLARVVAIVGAAVSSRAHAAQTVVLAGSDDGCPSRAAVASALVAIVPSVRIESGEPADGPRVELWDEGAQFRVSTGTDAREFTDWAHRCDERARKAAVFIALVLEPPTVRPPPPPPPPWPKNAVLAVELEAAALLDAAPQMELYSGGAAAALFVGARYVGGVLGVGALSPTTLELKGARARLWRIPVELGLRGRLRRGRVGLAIDAVAFVGAQVTEGLDVVNARTDTRAELGVGVAARIEWVATRRWVPFLAFRAEVVPEPYNLTLPSVGVVGTTPQYWVGGALGIALAIR